MGDVVRLPVPDPQRSCFKCRHFAWQIGYCTEFGEDIESELFAAADCPSYEPEED